MLKTADSVKKHSNYCKDHDAAKTFMPKPGTVLNSRHHHMSKRVLFVIYADFEAFTKLNQQVY